MPSLQLMPKDTMSGLRVAMRILKGIDDIGFVEFNKKDIVRNKLVSRIVNAYEEYDRQHPELTRKYESS